MSLLHCFYCRNNLFMKKFFKRNPVFIVFQENQTFLEKIRYQQLPNMMIHTRANFAPLDFINRKMIGKR